MVSAAARRAPLLWAIVPWVAASALERIVFQTSFVISFLRYRGMGWTTEAFVSRPRGTLLIDPMNHPAPGAFLSSPALWCGLAMPAPFLAAAVLLRRRRTPL